MAAVIGQQHGDGKGEEDDNPAAANDGILVNLVGGDLVDSAQAAQDQNGDGHEDGGKYKGRASDEDVRPLPIMQIGKHGSSCRHAPV